MTWMTFLWEIYPFNYAIQLKFLHSPAIIFLRIGTTLKINLFFKIKAEMLREKKAAT